MARSGDAELELVLDVKEQIADGVVRLTLRDPAGRRLPTWQPGAHIDLLLHDGLIRQYSLCSDPQDASVMQVAVLREAESRGGSAFVHDELCQGQPVRIRGPRNHFELVDADRYLFIAGGIGVTPIIPMLAAADERGATWRLLFGGRTRTSMAYADDLVARYGDRVRLLPQDECGLLDLDAALGRHDGHTVAYCCGPESLLRAVEERCADWPSGSLRVERFRPKEIITGGPDRSFEVEIASSGQILTVPPDRCILDVVEDAGISAPSSCTEGTCGTCETTVLSGQVDHRDSVLTDEEQQEGATMMICVSRARSARLVLDL